MNFTIRVLDDEGGLEIQDLQNWLSTDPGLPQGAVQRQEAPALPGALGPSMDLLTLALDPAAVGGAFTAITMWLSNRRTTISVRLGDREVRINSSDIDSAERAAQRLLNEVERDEPTSGLP